MEKKILQFCPRPEGFRRTKPERDYRPLSQLELISMQARNRYLDQVENTRRESLANLSDTPYDYWGITQKEK